MKLQNFNSHIKKQQLDQDIINKYSQSINVKKLNDSEYILFATNEIKKGEVILKIPSELFISIKNSCINVPPVKYCKEHKQNEISDSDYLQLFLLYETQVLKDKSKWYWYFKSFPENFNNVPLFYDEENSKFFSEHLESCYINKIINYNKLYLYRNFNILSEIMKKYAWDNDFKFTFESYCWAYFCLHTRAFYNDESLILVPVVDCINHSNNYNCVYNFDSNEYTLTCSDNISKDVEINISYGNRCNARLLANYGFTIDNNIRYIDQACIQINLDFIKHIHKDSEKELNKKLSIINNGNNCIFSDLYYNPRIFDVTNLIPNNSNIIFQMTELNPNITTLFSLKHSLIKNFSPNNLSNFVNPQKCFIILLSIIRILNANSQELEYINNIFDVEKPVSLSNEITTFIILNSIFYNRIKILLDKNNCKSILEIKTLRDSCEKYSIKRNVFNVLYSEITVLESIYNFILEINNYYNNCKTFHEFKIKLDKSGSVLSRLYLSSLM